MKNFSRKPVILFFIAAVFFSLSLFSCSFLGSFDDDDDDKSISITSLTMGKSSLSLKVGSMDYIAINIKPLEQQKNVKLNWNYDRSVIECDTSSNWGITIKGLSEGQTSIKCSYDGYDATCLVTVAGYEENYETTIEPYIYSNTTTIQTSPGITEKVFVSLYGGNAGDIDGYTWTIDNSSVASIQPTGQYCFITAKDSGYARIKVTHQKSTYPYYMGVYVFADTSNVTYITTDNNILTMNKDDDEKIISVSLVNGKDKSLDSNFSWEILNQDTSDVPVSLQYNENKAVIKPLESGSCTIRITHPDAVYPLDILCRVITVVKNVYIQPDSTYIYLDGDTEQTITSTLENIDISNYSIDDYFYSLEDYSVAEIVASVGNQVFLKGKANGSTKLIVSHPKAPYSREVLLIVTGQIANAIDASGYITTSQNYVRTKVGAEITKISVSLKGGTDGDESGFIWSVKQVPNDGESDVINLETPNGITENSRTVNATYVYGNAYITPKAEGTAVISISHPKIIYPTEILIKVLSEDAILEEPLYFSGDGILRILNGETSDYTVSLRGKNKTDSDDSGILWSIDDKRLSIAPNGNVVNVTAPSYGTGNTVSHITASHNKADTEKTVLVLTADTEEELKNMKALYSDKLYYNFGVNDEVYVMCSYVGFDKQPDEEDEEITKYDFSQFTWTVSDPSVISVEKNVSYPLNCTVKGLKSGKSILKGSISDDGTTYSCEFTMTVYPEGTVQTEPEIYFTTAQNVITLSGKEKTANVSVTPVRLSASEYSNITWKVEGEDIINVIPNGSSATVTALTDGEAIIRVSHPDSQNTLKIYVRVGSEYVIPEAEPIIYISAQDVLTMLRDDPVQKLQAVLVNYEEIDTSGFSFSIDNEDVATIYAQSDNGIAYIKPVSSGQAEITITNSKAAAAIPKKVLVVVGNSAEELAGFTYLSTTNNVVSIGEGNSKSISVTVKNSDSIIIDGFTWSSSSPEIVDIVPSGATAVLKGNKVGTAIISVKNTACTYPLQIIVQVVDPIAAAANPYIQLTSSVMTLTCGSTYTSITAELVGGNDSDKSDFSWSSNDSKIAAVYGQNEVGKVKALTEGTTYINVSHPKAAYPAQLLVVCDEVKESECSISVPSSIIAMKPTDSTQTITATLVNGSATDKYNFSWSLDVYDIIDFQYSANVCTITPKQTGSVTITISHPKAAYPQQIIVNVQQYSTFAFPNESMTFTQGDVKFISMQVPTTNVTTHVEYDVENSAICSITGTKTTAQITAVGSGTTIVKARLIASSTGVEQASSEMMVYVKEKEVNAVYITSSSTITTVNKGKSQTLSATLTGAGVETSDQYNLRWTTSDSDIVQVTGISSDGYVYGQSIYITALKSGEAVITCSHEKAASSLQFYVVVPGSAEKVLTLNKSYMTIVKGSSGSTLKADIENKESSNDYNNIIWTCESSNIGTEVCRIMGSGQTVTIYPLAVGEATVMAQLPDSSSVAKCTVLVEAGKSLVFETNTKRVQPKHSVTVKYTVSPPDAVLTWTMSQDKDYFSYHDNGCDSQGNGSVEIIGNSQNLIGNGTLICVTDGGAKAQCTVKVAWDYSFSVKGKTDFTITPEETASIEYEVNPADADVSISSTELDSVFTYTKTDNGNGTGTIVIKPLKEYASSSTIKVIATNPNNDNEEIGTKIVTAKFLYAKLTPVITFVKSSGKFSKYSSDSKTFYLGDGEDFTLNVKIAENNSSGIVKSVEYKNVNQNSYACQITAASDIAGNYIFTGNIADQIEKGYWVTEAYRPTYNGNKILNFETTLEWWLDRYENHSTDHRSSLGMLSTDYSTRTKYHPKNPSTDDMQLFCDTYKYLYLFAGGQNGREDKWSSSDSSKRSIPVNGSQFGKEKDSSLNGFYEESKFWSIAYWWCPGDQRLSTTDKSEGDFWYKVEYDPEVWNTTGHADYHMSIDPHIMTDNVTANYGFSINTDCEKEDIIGEISVNILHNGNAEMHTYPVILQIRNCEKNITKTTE